MDASQQVKCPAVDPTQTVTGDFTSEGPVPLVECLKYKIDLVFEPHGYGYGGYGGGYDSYDSYEKKEYKRK